MSNTRRAPQGNPLRQERFCSSTEYDRGLLGNIVAMRASLLDSAEERKLIFALQLFSWLPGGLKKVAADFLNQFAAEIATPAMRKFESSAGVYNADQVKTVRAEIPGCDGFPLAGEMTGLEILGLPNIPSEEEDVFGQRRARAIRQHTEAKDKAKARPRSYPAEDFQKHCRNAAEEELFGILTGLCIDPKVEIAAVAPWWCNNLIPCLHRYIENRVKAGEIKAQTQISQGVFDGLDYCLKSCELTLIEGLAGMGKTFSAKIWCEQHPGQVRYVQVPTTTDDASFMRRIAEAFGVGCGLSMKGAEVREKVERTAKASKLMLVLDEAHYCLTQDHRARRRPSRIAWIMNELVNNAVPVALLTTPQFEEDKARIKERTGWNWDQFDRRIGVPIHLPTELAQSELAEVARVLFPEGEAAAIKALVGYAIFSKSQLAGIEHIVKRARFEADRAGRAVRLEDIKNAIQRRMPIDAEFRAPVASSRKSDFGRKVESVFERETTPKLVESSRLEVS